MTLQDVVTPNKPVSHRAVWVLSGVWLAGFLLLSFVGISKLLPNPIEIVESIPNLWFNWGLGEALITSIGLNIQAVVLLFVISMSIAYLSVLPAVRPVANALTLGRFNGFVGIPLIFSLILGNAHYVKVALLVFGAGVFTIPSLLQIIRDIPQEEFDHARTLRFSNWRIAYEVIVRGRLAEFLDALRTNAAMCWMLVPMVEALYRFEGGIGAMMIDLNKHLDPGVYAVTFIVLGIGYTQDQIINYVRKTLCPYSEGN